MSSSSVTQRRVCDSPSPFTYPRAICRCDGTKYSRTFVNVSAAPGLRGKLFYTCSSCGSFVGWCLTSEAYELIHEADMSPVRPCTLVYATASCTCPNCGIQATIFVSGSDDNRGKLYYSCEACGKFSGWCLPVEQEPRQSVTMPTGSGFHFGRMAESIPNRLQCDNSIDLLSKAIVSQIRVVVIMNIVLIVLVAILGIIY